MAFPIRTTSSTISVQMEFLQAKGNEYENYQLQQKAIRLRGRWGGQCTVFVRQFLKTDSNTLPSLAKLTPVNSTEPELYAVIKTKESKWGHLGIVIDFTDEWVKVLESNVPLGSEKIGIRKLKRDDSRILGYFILGNN